MRDEQGQNLHDQDLQDQEAFERKLETAGEPAAKPAGFAMLAGGVLAAVTVLLPTTSGGSKPTVLAFGAIAAAIGVFLLVRHPQITRRRLACILAFGTALITVGSYEGGGAVNDNEMLYLWICLGAFNFLPIRQALPQLGLVGIGYGWLLYASDVPTDTAVTRWLVTMTTLLVGGLLIAALRGQVRSMVHELRRRARQDSLTGLMNREALEDRVALELARSQREGTPLSVMVADIDGFKSLNDTLGHPAGDHVLKLVAAELGLTTREVDAVARFGGDEFAVVLPGATSGEALAIAARMRQGTRTEVGPEGSLVTISIGVATAPVAGETYEALWSAADHAMYEAKRAGGDRVRVATGPVNDLAALDERLRNGEGDVDPRVAPTLTR